MNTQKNTIAYIDEQDGYYVAPVKENHSTLEEDISLFFKDEISNKNNYLKKTEKAHGNAETREYLFSEDIDWLYNKKEWNGLKSIGYAKRSYIDKNKCFLENSQKNLNLIRKFVLALLKRYKTTTKLSINSIRFNISMDFENEIDNILKKVLT